MELWDLGRSPATCCLRGTQLGGHEWLQPGDRVPLARAPAAGQGASCGRPWSHPAWGLRAGRMEQEMNPMTSLGQQSLGEES